MGTEAPPRVAFWGGIFDLLHERQAGTVVVQRDEHTDERQAWHVALEIVSPYPPETVSATLGIRPSRIETDEEGTGHVGEDSEWETAPLHTWALDSQLQVTTELA